MLTNKVDSESELTGDDSQKYRTGEIVLERIGIEGRIFQRDYWPLGTQSDIATLDRADESLTQRTDNSGCYNPTGTGCEDRTAHHQSLYEK
jgi:hypothetical protein